MNRQEMQETPLNATSKILKTISSAILYLFSIEYVGYNDLSVYRVGIFPLLLIGCLIIYSKPKHNYAKIINVFLILYLITYALCLGYLDENYMFPLFSIPLVYYFVSFWGLKSTIKIDYAKIFVWYSLPHILSYFMGMQVFHGTGRFMGVHNDPNFCGIFLVFSIIAAICLLKRGSIALYYKIIYFIVLIISVYLLFLTGSRGAMLSLALLLLVEFWRSSLNISWKVIVTLGAIFFIIRVYNYILTLPDWVSPDVSRVDSVLCRFKPDSMADGSNRTEQWAKIFETFEMQNNIFLPLGNDNVGMKGTYSHNTFIDFLIENGIVLGTLFLCFFMYAIIKTIKISRNIRLHSPEEWDFLYISYSLMLQLFFLSAISQKLFWLSLIFIFYIAFKKRSLNKKLI